MYARRYHNYNIHEMENESQGWYYEEQYVSVSQWVRIDEWRDSFSMCTEGLDESQGCRIS